MHLWDFHKNEVVKVVNKILTVATRLATLKQTGINDHFEIYYRCLWSLQKLMKFEKMCVCVCVCERERQRIYNWCQNNAPVRGVNSSCSRKATYNLQSAFSIRSSSVTTVLYLRIQPTSGNVGLYYLLQKKTHYKWTCAFQTSVVQGSTLHIYHLFIFSN